MAKKQNNNPNQLSLPTDIEVTGALVTIAKALGKDVTQLFAPMFNREVPKLERASIQGVVLKVGDIKRKKKAPKISKAEQQRRNAKLAKARDKYFKANGFGKYAKAK